MTTSPAPEWLAPHLAKDEQVRWAQAPGSEGFRPALVSVAIGAWLTFYVGFAKPSWWSFLPIWPERSVSPILGALAAGLLFLGDALQSVKKHRYTAYAITDKRLLRVPLAHPLSRFLPDERADAWPLSQTRVVEKESRRGKARVRFQVENERGRRVARFRVGRVRDEAVLLDALRAAQVKGI